MKALNGRTPSSLRLCVMDFFVLGFLGSGIRVAMILIRFVYSAASNAD